MLPAPVHIACVVQVGGGPAFQMPLTGAFVQVVEFAGLMQYRVAGVLPGTHALPAASQVVWVVQVGGVPAFHLPLCPPEPLDASHVAWLTQYRWLPGIHA